MDQIFLQNLYCWFSSKHVGHAGSTANKGRSSVNYRQSLTFGGLYLSCNDHCDRWFFQEIFFYYYFQKQPYADILQNRCCKKFCNIYRKTSVLEFLFNKVAGLSTSSQKRLQHRWLQQSENCDIFTNRFYFWNTSGGCFCQFDKVTVQWWATADLLFLIKNKIRGMVSTKKICRSGHSMLFTHY